MVSTRNRKSRWLLLTVGGLAVLVAVPVVEYLLREEFLIRRLASEDVLARSGAIRQLGAMGSRRAVPHLCAILEYEPSPGEVYSSEFLPEGADSGEEVRFPSEALQALRQIAPSAAAVVPSIFRSVELGNHSVLFSGRNLAVSSVTLEADCVVALRELAAKRPELLTKTLRLGEADTAQVAALALGGLRLRGGDATEAVAALLRRTQGPDKLLVSAVTWALNQFGPDVFPVVLDTLSGARDPSCAFSTAAPAFAWAGAAGASSLKEALGANHPRRRVGACVAVRWIGKEASFVADLLLAALAKDPDADVRAAAASAVHAVGVNSLFKKSDRRFAGPFAPTLRCQTSEITHIACVLAPRFEAKVLRDASGALFQQAVKPETAIELLVNALGDLSPDVRRAAVEVLGLYGMAAFSAERLLVEMLKAGEFRPQVVSTLARIGYLEGETISALVDLLDGNSAGNLFDRVARALRGCGVRAKDAVPILIRVLQSNRRGQNAVSAMQLLEALGPAAKEAVPVLLERLTSEWGMDRIVAARALGAMGDVRAVPALEKLRGWALGPARRALVRLGVPPRSRP